MFVYVDMHMYVSMCIYHVRDVLTNSLDALIFVSQNRKLQTWSKNEVLTSHKLLFLQPSYWFSKTFCQVTSIGFISYHHRSESSDFVCFCKRDIAAPNFNMTEWTKLRLYRAEDQLVFVCLSWFPKFSKTHIIKRLYHEE